MSCRNFLGLPDRRPTFRDRLETEPGITCRDPGAGGWFGRMAEQSPLTWNKIAELVTQRLKFGDEQFC